MPRLAAAFDVNPFPDRVRELKTWISEEIGPKAAIDALMSVIAHFRITRKRAHAILAEVEGLHEAFLLRDVLADSLVVREESRDALI